MFSCGPTKPRHLLQRFLYWSGILWIWRFVHRQRVTILALHGVMDSEIPTSWVPLRSQLSRKGLDKGLQWLSKHYHFVSLQDAVAMLTGKIPVKPYSVVLTFDDGYRNNFKHALPILRRYQAPAAFFVATGHVDTCRPFWFDRLDYALQCAPVDGRQVQIGEETLSLQAQDKDSLRASYKRLRKIAKEVKRPDHEMMAELEGLAVELEKECGQQLRNFFMDDEWSAIATWHEIKANLATDVTIGSHTVDHVRLGFVDGQTCDEQLRDSKIAIEKQLEQPCRYICYPDGSFSAQVAQQVRACGYEAALTTEEGTNQVGDDLMTLRRLGLGEPENRIELLYEVSGLSAFISQCQARLRNFVYSTTNRALVAVTRSRTVEVARGASNPSR